MYNNVLVTTVLITLLSACARKENTKINYAGELPPGDTAIIFAPGLITTNQYEHSAPAFSPDGNRVLWTVVDKTYRGSLYEMIFENGKWSAPHRPSFADSTSDDYYPGFSHDGKKLYFSSRRKMPAGYADTKDMRIWEVQRTRDGWSTPLPIDTTISSGKEYAHSVSATGNIFFSVPITGGNNMDIFTSSITTDQKLSPVQLPYNLNSIGYEDGPFIAPDERFIIFESNRPEGIDGSIDLYISFKNENDSWTLPVNMGPKINSPAAERFAKLSPDGKYLFGSNRNMSDSNWGFDIYWIDAKVIDEVKSGTKNTPQISDTLGNSILNNMNSQNSEALSTGLRDWLSEYPNSLDAIIMYSSALRTQKKYAEAEQLLGNVSSGFKNNPAIILETGLVKIGLNDTSAANALFMPIVAPGPRQVERLEYLSKGFLDMERFEESEKYFDQSMQLQPNPYQYLRRARTYAALGKNQKALVYAGKAADMGINSRIDYENDTDLQSLKKDPGWNMLLKKLK
ncbi:hypothetical protein [Pollutibacter soli]|uniref:hypothetical protein n=1 Tax=Pollutibacter soli TaxID=3034157 RepID=UPI003013EF10